MLRTFLLLLFLQICFIAFALDGNPVANGEAVITSGHARFTVLTNHVIRMEYAPNDSFNNAASLTFINRNLPVPAFTVEHNNGWLIIKTAFSTLHYQENSGKFNKGNLYIDYNDGQRSFNWEPGAKNKDNLKGTTRTLDGALGKFTFKGIRKLPIEDGILSRDGWSLVDDTQRPVFDNSPWPWVQARTDGDVCDWYFFGFGNNYKAALFDYTQVAGKISMPPKFAFGIWYSRYWNYTEQDMKDIVNDYRAHNIPLDVLVVDMDWHLTENSSPEIFKQYTPKPNGWTGFTWEKKYFPDYKEFLAWTDSEHLETCLNIHPAAGVQPHEAAYPAFAKAMGIDTTNHPTIPFNITDKKFATNYFDIMLHPYEKAGVDFWWLDWQQWGTTNIKGVNPTFYLNYVHFSDMQREGKRPLIFHRWGGLGNHRYEIGFSGDCIIDWRSLNYQPEFTATAANVGFGYWSHDIGGHMNPINKKNKQDPELFTRWVEWGAFSPIFRTHATKDPEIERRIWKYPEPNFLAMRKAMQERYALIPYIYTMARFAYDSGISIVHPMYYEYPDKELAYHLPHQYFFGNNMLVAPVCEPMKGKSAITQTVWLPDGDWYDYRNNNLIHGGKNVSLDYALDEIPVFVKAGSIIPCQTTKQRVNGSVDDTLLLTVYPEKNSAAFTLYEDDGTTEGYRQYQCTFTNLKYEMENSTANLTIENTDATIKHLNGKSRYYEVTVVSTDKPAQLLLNNKPTAFVYNEQNRTVKFSSLITGNK